MAFQHRIIPCLRYTQAKARINWLVAAFGFTVKELFETEEGHVAHAELVYEGNMIMIGSAELDTPFGQRVRQPVEIDGYQTQAPYVFVEDIDAHYAQAVAQNAEIAIPLEEQSYGGKTYSCFDPEGHLWNFGSFDPWK